MAYERPGAGVYVTATKVTTHEDPSTENGLVGAAIKQKAQPWSAGLTGQQTIAIGEQFHLRTKGIKQFATASGTKGVGIAAGTQGAGVWIHPADNTLKLTGAKTTGDLPFGLIVEVVGMSPGRGVPANQIRVDLDQKDTLVSP